MAGGLNQIKDALEALLVLIDGLDAGGSLPAIDRVRSDVSATLFHLSRTSSDKPIIAIIGGTGTGKSTLVNRLLESPQELTATSFRRTFTAGPIAITRDTLPSGFARLIHVDAEESPARGKPDRVAIVRSDRPILDHLTLIDTPDIDGELTDHHAAADRVFRWTDAVIFLVSPEKYQMPELQPYYRLAMRYHLPSLFVMNKADEQAVVDDYVKLLIRSGVTDPLVLALSRDDSTWQPASEQRLAPERVESLRIAPSEAARRSRVSDVASRIDDQILAPLRDRRQRVDRASLAIRSLTGEAIEINVHPLTQQLQRRLRERSVLYLMGPQRVLDRVRSVPTMLVRLPRSVWSWTRTGEFALPDVNPVHDTQAPDFRHIVVDQFQSLQSRIQDILRETASPESPEWKIPVDQAGQIVDEEVGQLSRWLETKWNATPRDTAILNKLMKVIPGADRVSKYSEATPYLLTGYLAMSGALFGHLDLLALTGYSTVMTLLQKVSDEVASRTRATNKSIATRYGALASRQIDQTLAWLNRQAPTPRQLDAIATQVDQLR